MSAAQNMHTTSTAALQTSPFLRKSFPASSNRAKTQTGRDQLHQISTGMHQVPFVEVQHQLVHYPVRCPIRILGLHLALWKCSIHWNRKLGWLHGLWRRDVCHGTAQSCFLQPKTSQHQSRNSKILSFTFLPQNWSTAASTAPVREPTYPQTFLGQDVLHCWRLGPLQCCISFNLLLWKYKVPVCVYTFTRTMEHLTLPQPNLVRFNQHQNAKEWLAILQIFCVPTFTCTMEHLTVPEPNLVQFQATSNCQTMTRSNLRFSVCSLFQWIRLKTHRFMLYYPATSSTMLHVTECVIYCIRLA